MSLSGIQSIVAAEGFIIIAVWAVYIVWKAFKRLSNLERDNRRLWSLCNRLDKDVRRLEEKSECAEK